MERLTGALEREEATLKTLQEAKREEAELAQALKERARLQEEELLHLGTYVRMENGKEGRT